MNKLSYGKVNEISTGMELWIWKYCVDRTFTCHDLTFNLCETIQTNSIARKWAHIPKERLCLFESNHAWALSCLRNHKEIWGPESKKSNIKFLTSLTAVYLILLCQIFRLDIAYEWHEVISVSHTIWNLDQSEILNCFGFYSPVFILNSHHQQLFIFFKEFH